MEYQVFESRVLELLYKTDIRLVAQQAASRIGCTIDEAQRFLEQMTNTGALTMEIDEQGGTYYDMPGRPPATLEPLSWTDADESVPASQLPQAALQPSSMATEPPPAVTDTERSVGFAVVLALLFGPLGMMYATVAGGLIMIVANIVILLLTWGVGFLFLRPIEVIWAVAVVSAHNKKIQQQIAAVREYELDMQLQAMTAPEHAASVQAHAQS